MSFKGCVRDLHSTRACTSKAGSFVLLLHGRQHGLLRLRATRELYVRGLDWRDRDCDAPYGRNMRWCGLRWDCGKLILESSASSEVFRRLSLTMASCGSPQE